jgi:hypothetical protein
MFLFFRDIGSCKNCYCVFTTASICFTLLPNTTLFKFLTFKLGYITEDLCGLGYFKAPVEEGKT